MILYIDEYEGYHLYTHRQTIWEQQVADGCAMDIEITVEEAIIQVIVNGDKLELLPDEPVEEVE